ncbi:MAG: PilN domain-containing protein [Acidobacteriia bacterium]|nr:PilN domain-containing protein [Terriglobia bacterium]
MIKINLLAEKKAVKAKTPSSLKFDGLGGTQNLLLAGVLILGVIVAGSWWWVRASELRTWKAKQAAAEVELTRLQEVRKKAEYFKKQKELLERKINLITELKKKQSVPVHILDQISKNLPDFLWLDSMSAVQNQISITGRATTYTAVSNFYDNLAASGYFTSVVLGKTSEVPQGVSFSLSCKFASPKEAAAPAPQG